MISVDEAVARICAAFRPLGSESVGLAAARDRVLAEDVVAKFDQPPFPVSAMDGYAVRRADVEQVPAQVTLIGEAPAGQPYAGKVGAGQTVRIFTGGVVPEGADAVVIQEDTDASGKTITVKEAPRALENIRAAGLDFRAGEAVLTHGARLGPRDLAVIAAADMPHVRVAKKPRIILVATGDELSRPGEPRAPGGIVASSIYALAAMVEAWGGDAVDFGILPDRIEAYAKLPEAVKTADLLITMGGASVGDHDLVQKALKPHGFELDFWKIAMRPGKPLIFGRLGNTPLLGLPGNPVSALVCSILFLRPAIATMLGQRYDAPVLRAELTTPLKANGTRQDFIRARVTMKNGKPTVEAFKLQDSSMQAVFARANGLILRAIGAPAAQPGDMVDVLSLEGC
jgi:molybdopterin molybdotransferase